ncbi:polysaccharide biosynthesis protein [Dethiosulfovibrio sp. F2B]|uniref:polysaccharide biosynthesis protein n=1 Tax=Dethiosulfovibrio faecalis TaxID=2720018 RepID=UPI001F1C5A46|nr:nucleoside-diphosphate sugar epimerase/dehydratase [Dethiosulfovibrio faecalis]MCF4151230.1 polysaccharide biosynthesis protein [Dethiosulfovibrio faecalis]
MKESWSVRLLGKWLEVGVRNRYMFFLDVLFCIFATWLGFALRLSVFMNHFYGDMAVSGLIFAGICVVSFYLGGIYRIYWPQASLEEFALLLRCFLVGSLIFVLCHLLLPFMFIPRSSLAITLLSCFVLVAAYRASWRFFVAARHGQDSCIRTVIVGAGNAGTSLARDLLRNGDELLPVGFVDDDDQKKDKIIAGLPVLGPVSDLENIILDERISVVLVAIPSASRKVIGDMLMRLSSLGVETRVLPNLRDIAGGIVTTTMLRKVRLEDLLARDPVELDSRVIADVVRQRVILITGAGGSIGSEISRQICSYGPSRVLLLGHGEHSIYGLCEEFREKRVSVPYEPIIADVADSDAMEAVFSKWSPSVVFHAGAHKHVPLMEVNPKEALRVNGKGTWVLADLCGRFGVERMVMVSTDKAVNPTSVMGATKRVAEIVVQQAQLNYPETRYMAVRFGNVLGSRGSVVPKFEKQIESGGPVTVTHPDMKRYFMIIPEAAGLVLQAGALGKGGEIFVLDMGDPVKIVDLAETLIRLHGYSPGSDIAVDFTGVRPGEKLFEELFYDPDFVDRTAHPKIFRSNLSDKQLPTDPIISEVDVCLSCRSSSTLSTLRKLVPEFNHP